MVIPHEVDMTDGSDAEISEAIQIARQASGRNRRRGHPGFRCFVITLPYARTKTYRRNVRHMIFLMDEVFFFVTKHHSATSLTPLMFKTICRTSR